MNKNILKIASFVLGFVLILFIVVSLDRPAPVLGSVTDGQGYTATTTGSQGQGVTGIAQLLTGSGIFGSYVITGANTGLVNFYDATTTDTTLRGNTSTSSILIASFPASVAASTYTFDVAVGRGLLVTVSGNAATGTITFKK